MHATKLISTAIRKHPDCPDLSVEPVAGICAITGQRGPCVPRKQLLGKSFTTGHLLAVPASDMVSVDAYLSLKFKWERMSSWFCDGEKFTKLKRLGVRDLVLAGNTSKKPFAGYATTSYKKHGSLIAPVNSAGKNIWLFEERVVDCSDAIVVSEWWRRLNDILAAGAGRTVIELLDCPAHIMRKVTLPVWLEFESWAKSKHRSSLYAFLVYLLPSQVERNEEAKQENLK